MKTTDDEMIAFHSYLAGLEQTEKSIEHHKSNVGYYKDWCADNKIEDIAYMELEAIKGYVKYMKKIPVEIGTQVNRINSMTKYYDFFIYKGIITSNPLRNFNIQNKKRGVTKNNFSEDELLRLYKDFVDYSNSKTVPFNRPTAKVVYERNKLIVSLVVFQGLHTGELDKLTVDDITINDGEGTIIVPSTSRSNDRILQLHSLQILPFYKYLSSLPEDQSKLFSIRVQCSFHTLLEEVKGINPIVSNLQHIRDSVLINWIKRYGKRKAQYMIGHRYVSSTEKFEVQDVSELSDLMEATHLFG